MRSITLAILFWLSSSLSLSAQASSIASQEELRRAVLGDNFDLVESLLSHAHREMKSGRATPYEVRNLFSIFETTHPDVIAFSEDWVQLHPASPYAHSARAFVLFQAGAMIRGTGTARITYPDALELHAKLHRDALAHAMKAYEITPHLLAASDAIIMLGNTTSNKIGALKVLDEVMDTNPNWGSLRRALHMSHKGWGGTFNQAIRICQEHAPLLSKIQGMDALTFCKLYVWDSYYREELDDWAAEILVEFDDPNQHVFAEFRVNYIIFSEDDVHEEDARFLHAFLTRPDVLAVREADEFDVRYAVPFSYDFQHETHINGAKRRAWHYLEFDPYNLEHIETMLAPVFRKEIVQDGDFTRVMATRVSPLRRDIKIDMLRRILKISPYDATAWHNFANAAFGYDSLANGLRADPYEINSIVYSNHGSWEVENHLANKLGQYLRVQAFNDGTYDEDWRYVLTDLDGQVICPLIRIFRMRQLKCRDMDSEEERYCYPNEEANDWYRHALSDAESRNVCIKERLMPVHKLQYSPIAVDFESEMGG